MENKKFYFNYNSDIYNSLPSVEHSDSKIKTPTFNIFLEAVKALLYQHHLETYAGLCLIHNHNTVESGTVMFQTKKVLKNGKDSLVTKGETHDSDKYPSSWIFINSTENAGFYPLEYSDDPAVAEGNTLLNSKSDFFKSFSSLLLDYKLEKYIGLAIVRRDNFSFDPEDLLVEQSTTGRTPSNIILPTPKVTVDSSKLIQTNWIFISRDGHHNCQLLGCLPQTKCFPGSEGHISITKGHDRLHSGDV